MKHVYVGMSLFFIFEKISCRYMMMFEICLPNENYKEQNNL